MNIEFAEIIKWLEKLISIPSVSGEEDKTAAAILDFFESKSIKASRLNNNIMAWNKYFDPTQPSILLNSHHDTIKPGPLWKRDPFTPCIEGDKLFGLGSNDAGASVAALTSVFMHFWDQTELKYNILLVLSAEEEISGPKGIISLLPQLKEIEFGIIGEPTGMSMAVAEKGLMVVDCIAPGKEGHAARDEGENAIYNAMKDIEWFKNFQFPKKSEWLGPVKMTVTIIHAGSQHNLIPGKCDFTVDIRSTDMYSHEEIIDIIKQHVSCEVRPRSLRLKPTSIAADHILVSAGKKLNLTLFGSPTLSDQVFLPFPTVKIGPGESARSHTSDEFVKIEEIREGIVLYKKLVELIVL